MLVVAASYLAAHVAFDWLARRLMIVSGAEYLLLGILLGPQVSGVLSVQSIASFAPIVTLGLGWMGAQIGSSLILGALIRVAAPLYRVAIVESLLTFAVTAAVMTWALSAWLETELVTAIPPGVALGALGTASAEAAVAVATRELPARGVVVRQLEVSTVTNGVIAVLASGLFLTFAHPTPTGIGRALTPTEWAVVTIAIGVVGGALFHLFLGDERKVDRLFVSLTGAIILVSGAATYLRLSPLLAALCFGAVLANTTRSRTEMSAALRRVDRPLYFALLVLAGAMWRPSEREWILPVLLFLVVRLAVKLGSARLAARWNGMLPELGSNWGRGLIGQGGLALAIALSYLYQSSASLPNLVFTAAVASVLLTDLLSARLVRHLLRAGA